jgi:hypothetical protein
MIEIDIVMELMGIEPAKTFILKAIQKKSIL